tara:strand:- start:1274 stop:1552 length:279 start_codon:yes stop_codon:yes gene_type:complete
MNINNNLINLLGKKFTIEILSLLMDKSLKYTEIEKITKNPKTTNIRLNEMTTEGLIERNVLNEKYRPVVYQITEKGKSALKLIGKINQLKNE